MEVGKGPLMRQFLELPVALGGFPPGGDWLLATQRRRLRAGCPPQEGAAAVLLLAYRAGRPVGRMTAHVVEPGSEARFGFMVVEGAGDADVVAALLAGAAGWAGERGRTTIIGPMSWGPQDEAGVLVAGHDGPVVTGRAWTPAWYGDLLAGAGLTPLEELRSYRLPAGGAGPAGTGLRSRAPLVVPGEMAPYVDPELLLSGADGEGAVVAVPDIAGAMAERADGRGATRGAWSMARRARKRTWEGCVVIALDGPEEVLIPSLCASAGRRGYQWVLSPWAPPGTEPVTPVMIHRLYTGAVADLI
jgi:hypothetical protein